MLTGPSICFLYNLCGSISLTGIRAYESEMMEKAGSEMMFDYKFVKDEDDASPPISIVNLSRV